MKPRRFAVDRTPVAVHGLAAACWLMALAMGHSSRGAEPPLGFHTVITNYVIVTDLVLVTNYITEPQQPQDRQAPRPCR